MEDRAGPLVVRREGLVLREWESRDVPAMVAMFDTAEIDRWTPLAHPFDTKAATSYVERAHHRRAEGLVQLAITEDGSEPLGEVLLIPTDRPSTCELGYTVGAQYRGRGLAARAVRALLPLAKDRGYSEARLTIAVGNEPSVRVARDVGFEPTADAPRREERKGYVLHLTTWWRAIP